MLLNCCNCLMEFCLYAISVCTLWVYTAACLFPDVRLTLLLILSKWDGSRLSAVEGGDSIVVKCGIRQLKEPCSCTLHKAINRGVCLISVCCRLILNCAYTALVGSSLDFFLSLSSILSTAIYSSSCMWRPFLQLVHSKLPIVDSIFLNKRSYTRYTLVFHMLMWHFVHSEFELFIICSV